MAFRQFQPNSLLVKEKKIEGKVKKKCTAYEKGQDKRHKVSKLKKKESQGPQ